MPLTSKPQCIEREKTAEELILSLRYEIDSVLRPLLLPFIGKPVALIEFPDHANVGDSAIWLGTRKYLSEIGLEVTYSCSVSNYSKEVLAKRIKDGLILLRGGGSFGDLYPWAQKLFETVISDFPKNKIIQLPQSVFFQNKENLKQTKTIFNNHSNLTLLLRDQKSLEFVRNEFSNPSLLCPDMALALGLLARTSNPVFDIVSLMRSDIEASGFKLPDSYKDIKNIDWLKDDNNFDFWTTRQVSNFLTEFPKRLSFLQAFHTKVYDRLASNRLHRGICHLSQGKVVITDRLHAHILCLLLGIPHVVLDNNYGKIRSFYDTWMKSCDIALWANSPSEVLDVVSSFICSQEVYLNRSEQN